MLLNVLKIKTELQQFHYETYNLDFNDENQSKCFTHIKLFSLYQKTLIKYYSIFPFQSCHRACADTKIAKLCKCMRPQNWYFYSEKERERLDFCEKKSNFITDIYIYIYMFL